MYFILFIIMENISYVRKAVREILNEFEYADLEQQEKTDYNTRNTQIIQSKVKPIEFTKIEGTNDSGVKYSVTPKVSIEPDYISLSIMAPDYGDDQMISIRIYNNATTLRLYMASRLFNFKGADEYTMGQDIMKILNMTSDYVQEITPKKLNEINGILNYHLRKKEMVNESFDI